MLLAICSMYVLSTAWPAWPAWPDNQRVTQYSSLFPLEDTNVWGRAQCDLVAGVLKVECCWLDVGRDLWQYAINHHHPFALYNIRHRNTEFSAHYFQSAVIFEKRYGPFSSVILNFVLFLGFLTSLVPLISSHQAIKNVDSNKEEMMMSRRPGTLACSGLFSVSKH